MANEPVRPRIVAFLERQDGFVHVGGIARGAQVSAPSVRKVLLELERAGRLETCPAWKMPGQATGSGYRLRPAGPAPGRAPERHCITVSGARIDFTTCEEDEGRLLVNAPGVLPFTTGSLDDARDVIRSLFSKSATRD